VEKTDKVDKYNKN